MKINAQQLKDAGISIIEEAEVFLETPLNLDSLDGFALSNLTPGNYGLITNEETQEPLSDSTFSIYEQGVLVLASGTLQDVQNYLEEKFG